MSRDLLLEIRQYTQDELKLISNLDDEIRSLTLAFQCKPLKDANVDDEFDSQTSAAPPPLFIAQAQQNPRIPPRQAPPNRALSGNPTINRQSVQPAPRVPRSSSSSAPSKSNPRDYQRPWLDNVAPLCVQNALKAGGAHNGGPSRNAAGPNGSSSKAHSHYQASHDAPEGWKPSTFLEHCYGPRADGPDADLIQMLEREYVVRPSAGVVGQVRTKFEDIAGLKFAKQMLEETVVLPLKMPEFFIGIRRPWKGVLLYGPPGTGKTMLARAVATQCDTSFFSINPSTLASKYRGDSEKLVRLLFEMARFYAPSTIFFDEIDALASRRGDSTEHEASRRVKSELLVQMDGIRTVDPSSASNTDSRGSSQNENGSSPPVMNNRQVTIIAATNRPWDLDEAFLRRFEKRIYIPLPEEEGRKQLIKFSLEGLQLADDFSLDALSDKTTGYSGSDVASVCREAAMMGLRKKILEARRSAEQEGGGFLDEDKYRKIQQDAKEHKLDMSDFAEALKNVQTSVTGEDLLRFEKWTKDFGSV
eukprot:GDKK01060643.1.p1 GENE.GDKK01060643.1~~GDKK01060643.1.p1  ORF type:complete len:588 (-),score=118.22 GDKK01060643.1:135-1727(-)